MTREDYPAFVKALLRTAETFREPLSPDRMDAFFEALSDLPLAQVVSALRMIEQRAEWFPRGPAVVRAAVAGTVDEAAETAWQRFRWALQHVTIYDNVDFQDPVLTATVMSMFGGWTQTAEIQSARMGQIRQDFLKTYATCVRAGMANAPSYRVALPGTQSKHIYAASHGSHGARDMELNPEDILAFILTGKFSGEEYQLDPAQVQRTEEIMTRIAQGRMYAVTEIPPLPGTKAQRGAWPPADPNLN